LSSILKVLGSIHSTAKTNRQRSLVVLLFPDQRDLLATTRCWIYVEAVDGADVKTGTVYTVNHPNSLSLIYPTAQVLRLSVLSPVRGISSVHTSVS
jgi:hypothetical protein